MSATTMSLASESACGRSPWLPLEHATERGICGGKAVNLGCLLRAGLPVPAGVVLTVQVLQDFMAATGLDARVAALEAEHLRGDMKAETLEQSVRTLFEQTASTGSLRATLARARAELGAHGPFAVRSSAVGEDSAAASYAGMMDSVLDVEPTQVEGAVKRVWASRWSARAAAYAHARGGSTGSIAIIVQCQVDAQWAGVLFTRSPDRGHEQQMTCEYCAGLADKLVTGAITPGRLRIDRASFCCPPVKERASSCSPPVEECASSCSPPDKEGRDAQCADGVVQAFEHDDTLAPSAAPSAESIADLAAAGLAAERLFGAPQDIEWALDASGRVWLVQSRPITTPTQPGTRTAQGSATPAQIDCESRRVLWSNANVNENFPAPITPLLYSLVAPGYSAYFANLGHAFGLARWRLQRMAGDLRAIVGVQAGRLYYNLSAIHAVLRAVPFGERLVAWFDDFTGASDPHAHVPAQGKGFGRSLRDCVELAWITAKTTWQYAFIQRRSARFESCVDDFAARSAPQRLGTLDTLALRDLLRDFMQIRLERWTDAALCDAAAMVCYGALKAAVARALPGADATSLHNDLLKGLTGLKSAEPVNELWALADAVRTDAGLSELFESLPARDIVTRLAEDPAHAQFERMFRGYVERWGFRCSGELMLTQPSFQEEPEKLLEIVRTYARQSDASPRERLARQRAERTASTRRVLAQAAESRYLRLLPWPNHATHLKVLIRATHESIALRERARLQQALLYNRLRRIALEIGARLDAAGTLRRCDDVFFLTMTELDELLSGRAMFPGDSACLAAMRRASHARFEAQCPPDTIVAREGEYPDFSTARSAAAAPSARLHGSSVCGGVSTGRARVLTDVCQTRELEAGDVLVTRQTDPGWAPAFVHIGALVLERGGMLSHGAILAREYGIPTIVGIAGATERIADRATVRVDADHGDVHVLA